MITTTSRLAGQFVLVLAVLGTIGCDRVTKHVAAGALAGVPGRSYLGDTIRLGYVENRGGFLSGGASLPPAVRTLVFTVGNGVMLAVLLVAAIRQSWRGWAAVGVALFIAGGASNWIDRAARGSVVDFLNVGIGPVRTGVFNVADMAILLGAAILVFVGFRSMSEGSDKATNGDGAA